MVKSHMPPLERMHAPDIQIIRLSCPEKLLNDFDVLMAQFKKMPAIATPLGCDIQTLALRHFALGCGVTHEPILLLAALLCPVALYAGPELDSMLNHLSEKQTEIILKLIQGSKRMQTLDYLAMQGEYRPEHTSRMRKMLLAMVDDIRVIVLKLIERLCFMQHLHAFSQSEQTRVAEGVLNFYAALANRLGVWQLKWPLEDLAFRYLEPKAYQTLAKAMNVTRLTREVHVEQMRIDLADCLKKAGVCEFKITGRAKHLYSIHKKMQRKRDPLSAIHDVIAMRVVVEKVEHCYQALSAIHAKWDLIGESFDDYIAVPKSNGYQSLHTALMVPEAGVVEVQIRTEAMHSQAELGVASHWQYKEGSAENSDTMISKLALLRDLMAWQEDLSHSSEEMSAAYRAIFSDRIYPFTPQYDVFDLPAGATPLDVAYHIHTTLGHSCKGAKVNGGIVPLTTPLETGDVVEILTQKKAKPSRDWLRRDTPYVVTSRARSKISQWFRAERLEEHIQLGRQSLIKELKRSDINQAQWQKFYATLAYKNKSSFYAAIGRGELGIGGVIAQARRFFSSSPQREVLPISSKKIAETSSDTQVKLCIDGGSGMLSYRAGCCLPMPGDTIKGMLTQSRGVSVHREDCINMQYLMARYPEKIMDVSWSK